MSLSVQRVSTGQCTEKSLLVSSRSSAVMACSLAGGRLVPMTLSIRGAVLEEIGRSRPYAESAPLSISELELDPPGDGELLLRIEAAGLCHSDLSVVDGNRV